MDMNKTLLKSASLDANIGETGYQCVYDEEIVLKKMII